MNCIAVRELLPEMALGVLDRPRAMAADKHLLACAACRKEANDMARASATMGFALAPTAVPDGLEERVVGALEDARGGGRRADQVGGEPPRRAARRATTLVLAASLALAGMGVGAVFAAREARQSQQAERDIAAQRSLLERFRDVVSTAEGVDPDTQVYLGVLSGGRRSGGSALTIVSPTAEDQAIVMVTNLPREGAPYTVDLRAHGRVVRVGRITALDAAGGATTASDTRADLSRFDRVVVRDATGALALRGFLAAEAPVASPSA